jgi:(heptosyl)LPS beta-1,4-glucosyltransferase
MILGKWMRHTGWWPDYNVRVFKKDSVVWTERIHSQPVIHGETFYFDASENMAITHFNYVSVTQYLEKMLRYSDVEAKEFFKDHKKVTVDSFVSLPAQEFLSRFFAGKGYKDGVHGLVLSMLQAMSVFVMVLKVWELQGYEPKEEKDLLIKLNAQGRKVFKQFLYWTTTELLSIEKSVIKKVKLKLQRKRSRS